MFQAYQLRDIKNWKINSCACRKIDAEKVKELAEVYFTNHKDNQSRKLGFIVTALAFLTVPFLFNYSLDHFGNEFIQMAVSLVVWVALIGFLSIKETSQRYKKSKCKMQEAKDELLGEHKAYIWFNDRMYLGFKLPGE